MFNRHLSLYAACLLAVVAMVGLTACSGGDSDQQDKATSSTETTPSTSDAAASGVSNDSITIGFSAEPVSLDFTTHDGVAIPQVLLYNVYETLVKIGPDGDIIPALAKSWTVSDDGTVYTFELVDNATFTNGDKFTAKDAVFSIKRVKNDWAISLKSGMDSVKSAVAVSPTELKVTLKHRDNAWLYKMTTRIGAMMTKSGIKDIATNPVGTGPYKLKEWKRGDKIVLQRNDDYWGEEPYFETVTFAYMEGGSALTNALLSGTIDVIADIGSPYALRAFADKPQYKIIEGTTNGEVLLSFNNSAPPLDDVRVRRAIRYGINNKKLLKACMDGHGTLIGSMVPPTDPWYEDLTGMYPYNPEKAKKLLKEAGAAHATLRLRLPSRPYARSCGTVVQSQLEKIGLTIKMDELEFPAAWLTKVFHNADYDMTIIKHSEPHDIATVFGNPDYYLRYDNPQVREDFAKAEHGSHKEQIKYMKKAAKAISKDAAAGFLFLYPNLIVAEKDITGLPKNAVSESFDVSYLGKK